MDPPERCLLCQEPRAAFRDCSTGPDIPNFRSICKYLKIKVTKGSCKDVEDVPWFVKHDKKVSCDKFLCLCCFERVSNLSNLYKKAEEIQLQIASLSNEIKNIVLATASPDIPPTKRKKRGFAYVFKKIVEGRASDVVDNSADSHVEADEAPYKSSNGNVPAISNVDVKVEAGELVEEVDDEVDDPDYMEALSLASDDFGDEAEVNAEVSTLNTSQVTAAEPQVKEKEKRVKWSCRDCNVTFESAHKYFTHRKIHRPTVDVPTYYEKLKGRQITVRVCPICSHQTRHTSDNLSRYMTHMLSHEQDSEDLPNEHKCDSCSKSFKLKLNLDLHKVCKHKPRRLPCDRCAFMCTSKEALITHLKTHSDSIHSCRTCPMSYTSQELLLAHVEKHSKSSSKPLVCANCDFVAKSSRELTKHCRDEHPQVKRPGEPDLFVCETCGKDFGNKFCLAQHRYANHKGKPYTCEHCGMQFRRPQYFQNHLRTHTGEKPFACTICNKGFNRRDILIVHMKIHGMDYAQASQAYKKKTSK